MSKELERSAPRNGEYGQWWKTALAAIGAVIAGGIIAASGVRDRLDKQEDAIREIKAEQRYQGQQLDKMDQKLDRVLKRD